MNDNTEKIFGVEKKTILLIIGLVGGLLLLLGVIIGVLNEAKDPNIQIYSEKMIALSDKVEAGNSSVGDSYLHVTEEVSYNGIVGEKIEYYLEGEDYMEVSYLSEYNGLKSVQLMYDQRTCYFSEVDGRVKIDRAEGFYLYSIPNIDSTYYRVLGNDLTYEETGEQFIFHYINNSRKGDHVSRYYMTDDGIQFAQMDTYFDKDWNIQKIVITESYEKDIDGKIETENMIATILFQNTSKEEIQNVMEEMYQDIREMY